MKHLIGIDGIDGAGKSHLAAALEQAARGSALLLRVDDFRRPVDWQRSRDEAATYYDSYYDFGALDAVLAAFRAGEDRASAPIFDSVAERTAGRRELAFDGIEIALVEGVFIRRLPAMATATHVYLATSEAEAHRRIAGRDQAKGRSLEEVERRIDRRYFPSQRRYHEELDPRGRAHLVIDHEELGRPRVIHAALERRPEIVTGLLAEVFPEVASLLHGSTT